MKAIHKILIQNVKDRRKIREEEALEKRNVWTLLDRDYAEMERERIREKKLVYMTHSQTISRSRSSNDTCGLEAALNLARF